MFAAPRCLRAREYTPVSSRGIGESGHGYNSLLKPAAGSLKSTNRLSSSVLPIPYDTLGSQEALCFLAPHTSKSSGGDDGAHEIRECSPLPNVFGRASIHLFETSDGLSILI